MFLYELLLDYILLVKPPRKRLFNGIDSDLEDAILGLLNLVKGSGNSGQGRHEVDMYHSLLD